MADIFCPQQMPQYLDLLPFDLDCLVDDSLANTCTLFDADHRPSSIVQVQKTQQQDESPFHESDSGMSEAAEFGGEPITTLDEMFDSITPRPFMLESDDSNDQDGHLMSYLDSRSGSPAVRDRTEDDSKYCLQNGRLTRSKTEALTRPSVEDAHRNRSTPSVILFGHSSLDNGNGHTNLSKKPCSVQSASSDDDSEIDVNVTDNESAHASAKNRGSVKVSLPGSALPSSSTNTNSNVTSVKVLRIVQSGNNSNTEDDVVKALEERNRKNAEMAKVNRMKKKAYVGKLEKEVEDSRKRIDQLEGLLNNTEEERDSCMREVQYLKAVLANQSALAGLLKNIPNVNGVTLSSSMSRKRVAELDHSYFPAKKECSQPLPSAAGVCLHVDNDHVSLEFCRHCADMAHGVSN